MRSTSTAEPVSEALFPKARRKILGLLFGRTDRAFYLREIVDLTGLGVGHVQREVQRLSQGGVIRRSSQGRHVYYQANPSCPVFEELRRLVTKSMGAVATLRQALEPIAERIDAAFIFGSVAHGTEQAESDLDLMVIGKVSFAETVAAIRQAESRAGRAINPTVYPPGEIRSKLATGHHFLVAVIQSEKLFVVGNEDELRDLLE